MTPEQQQRDDMAELMRLAPFRRFLFRAIQSAGILHPTTDGSEGRHLAYAEGRRNLGLELLADAETANADPHPESLTTLFLILSEEAQRQPKEPKRGKYDRSSELDQPDAD